jgi:hypothetical protein
MKIVDALLADGLEQIELPGNHHSIMLGASAQAMAERLRAGEGRKEA